MYKEINGLILDATKNHDNTKKDVLRLIKNEFVKAEKNGKTITESEEIKILMKMAVQRQDSIEQFKKGGREDLVENEQKELDIINSYLPKPATDEEIVKYTNNIINEYVNDKRNDNDSFVISMKDMRPILSKVQEKYPTANGKVVSSILQKYMKNK